MRYIAILEKQTNEQGLDIYGVIFPDFMGCVGAGETADEAILDATEALLFHIEGMKEDSDDIPAPRTLDEISKDAEYADAMVNDIVVYIPVIPYLGKSQQYNFKSDIGLMNAVDNEAARLNITRTAFIVGSLTDTIKHL